MELESHFFRIIPMIFYYIEASNKAVLRRKVERMSMKKLIKYMDTLNAFVESLSRIVLKI